MPPKNFNPNDFDPNELRKFVNRLAIKNGFNAFTEYTKKSNIYPNKILSVVLGNN